VSGSVRLLSATPAEFRRLLLRLGPTFVKMGQYLALRPDLLPQAYCDELMALVDRVEAVRWAEARAVLAAELGGDPEEIFSWISRRPVAAGSLAQVHVARLQDDTEVAVKIQRPGIAERVERDLRRLRIIGRLLELSGASVALKPREVAAEIGDWMRQEIDFRYELANLERLHRLAAGSASQRIPRPYPRLSTGKVLTAEYLHGTPVSEILLALRSGRRRRETERLRRQGIDLERLAENLVLSCLGQIFRYHFFHADLHPGNLLALPGGVVGFVDFGLCDEADPTVRESQLRYLSAVYHNQTERMFKALSEILIPGERTDMDAFRRDFITETGQLELRRRLGDGGEQGRSPIAQYLVGLMRAARRNDLQVPTQLLSMYRALLTAETVANQLGVREGLRQVGRGFFDELQRDEVVRALDAESLQGAMLGLLGLKRDAPGQVHQILSDLADGSFTVRVYVAEAPKAARARTRRARMLATAVLSVAVAFLLTVPGLPRWWGISLAWPLAAALVVFQVWTFVLWRRLG
jgi:ubiquinone biosynthesis protein